MNIALITGSSGLIGSEAALFFSKKGFKIVGIDNDMRRRFFGPNASTLWNKRRLEKIIPSYVHHNVDIRNQKAIERIFSRYNKDIRLVIHTAAQPSHDWAAKDPQTDFGVNTNGTLNLLEATRRFCPKAVFIFTSTNKVYGDLPNRLPFIEQKTRYEIKKSHPFYKGIDESMSIDASLHSLFGASKVAADILVQEYGRYFGMSTVSFRAGCLTGPHHSGAMLHGFLSYLMKCVKEGKPYTVFGYKGKQVRDNIHSFDVVSAFYEFYKHPKRGEVYNIGGGRENNCSMLEAIKLCEKIAGKKLKYTYSPKHRIGDHIWYISDCKKFKRDYPTWQQRYRLKEMFEEIYDQV